MTPSTKAVLDAAEKMAEALYEERKASKRYHDNKKKHGLFLEWIDAQRRTNDCTLAYRAAVSELEGR